MAYADHLREFFALNWRCDGGSGLDVPGFLAATGCASAGDLPLDVLALLLRWVREQREDEADQVRRAAGRT